MNAIHSGNLTPFFKERGLDIFKKCCQRRVWTDFVFLRGTSSGGGVGGGGFGFAGGGWVSYQLFLKAKELNNIL